MRIFLSLAAALTLGLGLAWLFAPTSMLEGWGVAPEPGTAYMSRRYAGLFFGYSVTLWLARQAPPSPALAAILAGTCAVCAVMTGVSLLGLLTGVVGPAVWSAVAVEAALAAAACYFWHKLVAGPRP